MTKDEFKKQFGSFPSEDLLEGDVIMCGSCKKRQARVHRTFGIQVCGSCQEKRNAFNAKHGSLGGYEIVPQRIKDERVKYLKSQIQSHRQGELSKEFVESYPQKIKDMVRDGALTQQEVDKAKPVWKDLPNYDNLSKTL